MTRVLLLGTGALPDERLPVVDFPQLRTWQFLRGLLEAGFDVSLITGHPEGRSTWQEARLEGRAFRWCSLPLEAFDRADLPSRWCLEVSPDVVVSAGPFAPARAAARMPAGIPVCIDLPGDLMAEAQLRAATTGDPAHVLHAHRVLSATLARADAFTVVSQRQRAALLGQLGLVGRLTGDGVGLEQVFHVPVGIEPCWLRWGRADMPLARRPGRIIWPGAVNTWADIGTFFEACERVMTRRSDLEAVVTGGPIAGHEEAAYRRLEGWVRSSSHTARWRLTGWIDAAAAAREVRAAAVGVSLDVRCLEAFLGSRTRLLYGAVLGLPWITTPGCELAEHLVALGMARAVPVGDVEAVGEAILAALEAAAPGNSSVSWQGPAHEQLMTAYSGSATMGAVVGWVRSPTTMPPPVSLEQGMAERMAELERALAEIQNGPTWRVLGAVHRRLARWTTRIRPGATRPL